MAIVCVEAGSRGSRGAEMRIGLPEANPVIYPWVLTELLRNDNRLYGRLIVKSRIVLHQVYLTVEEQTKTGQSLSATMQGE